MTEESSSGEVATLLRALVALAIQDREERTSVSPGGPKTEVILSGAGLDAPLIASLMGKTPASVRMAISRARKGNSTARGGDIG